MNTRSEFAIAEVMPGKLNALVKNIMRQIGLSDPNEAVRLVNSGMWILKRVATWIEKDGLIYLTLISNGMTGKDWINHFERRGITISNFAKELLLSEHFKPAKKGTSHNISIIKGDFFSDDDNRITSRIRKEAESRKMTKPNSEIACLIRDLLTNEDIEMMGLFWIVAMHEPIPINGSGGDLGLLGANRYGDRQWLYIFGGRIANGWPCKSGFAFVTPQANSD